MSKMTIHFPIPTNSPSTPQTWFEIIPPTVIQLQITAPCDPPPDSTFDYTAAFHFLLTALPTRFPSLKHINLDILTNLLAYFRSGDEADALIEAFYDKGVVLGCRALEQWLGEQMDAYVAEEGDDYGDAEYDMIAEDEDDECPEVRAVHVEYDEKVRVMGLTKGLTMKEYDEECGRLWEERMKACRWAEEEAERRRREEREYDEECGRLWEERMKVCRRAGEQAEMRPSEEREYDEECEKIWEERMKVYKRAGEEIERRRKEERE